MVELLVVMAVILVVIGLVVPAVTSLKSSGDAGKAVYDIAGILDQSRAYALANNTYVYVGLKEVSATQPGSSTQTAGSGQVVLAVVATRDGTQGYSASSLQSWSAAYPTFASNLTTVGKPMVLNNLHVPDLGQPPTTGNMVRPAVDNGSSGTSNSLGNAGCVSAMQFDYPVGSALNAGKYSFTKVIQFDPQGVARIQTASSPTAIAPYMEIGVVGTHGATVPVLPTSPTGGNIAAIQIDGMTGAVRIYRP